LGFFIDLILLSSSMALGSGIIGVFHWLNPSVLTMALGSTPPLTEKTTRSSSWGVKVAGVYGWQPYHLHVPNVWKFWKPQPPDNLRAYPDL
jgi:hypothetical protein